MTSGTYGKRAAATACVPRRSRRAPRWLAQEPQSCHGGKGLEGPLEARLPLTLLLWPQVWGSQVYTQVECSQAQVRASRRRGPCSKESRPWQPPWWPPTPPRSRGHQRPWVLTGIFSLSIKAQATGVRSLVVFSLRGSTSFPWPPGALSPGPDPDVITACSGPPRTDQVPSVASCFPKAISHQGPHPVHPPCRRPSELPSQPPFPTRARPPHPTRDLLNSPKSPDSGCSAGLAGRVSLPRPLPATVAQPQGRQER